MNYHLVNAILRAPWLIDQEWIMNRGGIVMKILSGERAYDDDDRSDAPEVFDPVKQKNRSYVISGKNIQANRWTNLNDPDIPEGSTAIIPIRSEIMKYDAECGGARGTMSIEQDIKTADRNGNISGILLVFDSPGGEVTHTDLISKTIADTKTPVVAYVEGMACSAAYWMASGANKIIASSNIDRVGSIGTMCYFYDMTPYWEKQGVKFHEFYATKSTEKNKDFNEALKGNYAPYTTKVLDKLNENFHEAVKANRPQLDASVFKGASFFADEAIELGLVDEIGSMEYALDELSKLSKSTFTANVKQSDTMKLNKTFGAILGFFGIATEQAEETDLTTEMVEKMNTELVTRASTIADLQLKADAAADIQVKLDAAMKELQDEKTAHQTTQKAFDDFKAKDAAEETTAVKGKDQIEAVNDDSAKLAHNQIADELM